MPPSSRTGSDSAGSTGVRGAGPPPGATGSDAAAPYAARQPDGGAAMGRAGSPFRRRGAARITGAGPVSLRRTRVAPPSRTRPKFRSGAATERLKRPGKSGLRHCSAARRRDAAGGPCRFPLRQRRAARRHRARLRPVSAPLDAASPAAPGRASVGMTVFDAPGPYGSRHTDTAPAERTDPTEYPNEYAIEYSSKRTVPRRPARQQDRPPANLHPYEPPYEIPHTNPVPDRGGRAIRKE